MLAKLGRIEAAVSPARLSPYREEANGDLAAAIALYEWNASVSAAFWLDIGHGEVVIRNAMNTQLVAWSMEHHGEARWYLDPGGLFTPRHRLDIAAARSRLQRTGKPEDVGRVVAELSLGFWRYLAAGHYDRTLWRQALTQGFPGRNAAVCTTDW